MPSTVAFSPKGGYWKTRYSFYSYCYAFLDRLFFSFAQVFGRQPVWEHNDDVVGRTSFYNVQGGSAIAVTFNEQPSSNKIYKAFSLESTNNVDGVSVLTVNDSTVADQAVNPTATVLEEKGGIMYGSVGLDQRLTGANVKLVGVVQGVTTGAINTVEIQFIDGGDSYNLDADGSTRYFFANVQDNPDGTTATTYFQFNVASLINPVAYNNIPTALALAPLAFAEPIGTNVIYFVGGAITLPGVGNTYLYSATPGEVNGEQARGHTVNAVVTLGVNNYELYALNLEYEETDYDHRDERYNRRSGGASGASQQTRRRQ
jgi:hypothetical protein